MDETSFGRWREVSVREYAADMVRAGYFDKEHSFESAEKQLDLMIPKGLKTAGHFFGLVVDEQTAQRIGVIWYGESPTRADTMFIYDIRIDEGFRGQGKGKAALELVEEKARGLGKKRLALQVFGHNKRAWKLYRELGYTATSVMMAKDL